MVLLYRYLASRTITGAGFATTSTDVARTVLLSVTMSRMRHELMEPASCSFTAACLAFRSAAGSASLRAPPALPLYNSTGWGLSRTVIASMLDPIPAFFACVQGFGPGFQQHAFATTLLYGKTKRVQCASFPAFGAM